MHRKFLLLASLTLALTGCNTILGVAKDVQVGCEIAGPAAAAGLVAIPIAGPVAVGICAGAGVVGAVGAAERGGAVGVPEGAGNGK